MSKYIFGKKSVIETINSNIPIIALYTSKKIEEKHNFKIIYVDNKKLDQMVSNRNHQGFVIEIKNFEYQDINNLFKKNPNKILILDHIQDPRNLGAILRTCNALGWKNIIIPKNRAVEVNETVLKVASGGQINLNIYKVDSLQVVLQKLKAKHYWAYVSYLNKKAKNIKKIKINEKAVVVIGNEEKGVSNTLIKMADELFYIPMEGNVQSLNVSVALGIILFAFK